MRLFSSSLLGLVPALLLFLFLGGQQQGVQAIPGGGLLWSSLNTTAVQGEGEREGGRMEGDEAVVRAPFYLLEMRDLL